MKNSEQDILKRFLQDTFSDFEPEPNPEIWENIRKEIQPHQPKIGAGLNTWIIPVVALLLLVGGIVWDNNNVETKPELALNSINQHLIIEPQLPNLQESNVNIIAKEWKIPSVKKFVNKATSKGESKVPKIEQSSEVPTFSTLLNEPAATLNVEEFSVSTKAFVGVSDELLTVNNLDKSENAPVLVSVQGIAQTNNRLRKNVRLDDPIKIDNNRVNQLTKYTLENSTNHQTIKEVVSEEVRSVKTLETLKNKGFVLTKNEVNFPQITGIVTNKDPKPVRRPMYMSLSITPIQTYRILTVNHLGIQNLQTNNLFDNERNGWAFELGITKPIGNKWNLRSSISYLKMRQWVEYQVNTNNIFVKNLNNNANAVSVANNNEFIGQIRTEAKTLQMVGLKADVQKFFSVSGRNRYFISGGSQLMVEPNEKQANVFINVSAGFQHVVNKDCFLTIEPTASYLLNNINDSKSLIQTNAYNLGLKVGVSFKVK